MKSNNILCQVVPDTRRSTNGEKYPLKLRITYKGLRRYYGTGHTVTLNEWEKINTSSVKGRLREIRNDIVDIEKNASRVANQIAIFNFTDFQDAFFEKPIQYQSLESCFRKMIKDIKSQNRAGTVSAYQTAMGSFKKYSPNAKLHSISSVFLHSYEKWMLENGKSLTTVGIYVRALRAIINKAIADNYFSSKNYPFGRNKYIIPAGKKAKRSLKIADIKKIFEYKPKPDNFFECRSLDFWKFTYLANGINMADIAHLKWKDVNDESITFYRQKTIMSSRKNLVLIEILRNDKINEILSKWSVKSSAYVFGIISIEDDAFIAKARINQFTKITNKWMKKIAKILEIATPVTTYVARHSFSTILLRNGASVEFISESLGHADIKTTQNYLGSFDIETKKERLKALVDF
jgi:site-specific recombinase XerD